MTESPEIHLRSAIPRTVRSVLGKPLRITLLILIDLLWSFTALQLIFLGYRTLLPGPGCPAVRITDALVFSVIIVIINSFAKCYHGNVFNPGMAINQVEELRRISLAVFGAYILGWLFLFLDKRGNFYPLLPLLISMICTCAGFPVMRFLVRSGMKKAGIGQIRVLVAGMGKTAGMVADELKASSYYGYEIIGFLDDDIAKKDTAIQGRKWIGRLCDASALARQYQIHSIICCLPPPLLPQILRNYTHTFKHVLMIPTNDVMPITAIYPTSIGFVSGFEFQNRLLLLFPQSVKRVTEMLLSGCFVVVLFPLFAVLAVLVKLSSPGPVFYTAKRLGVDGKIIKVFKFRTMYRDAESRLESLLEENPDMKSEWEKEFKLKKDPRVTAIGHFLRRTSLDELPQFINVLRREMSIIGPRPIVRDEVKYYGEAYDFLKRVRPGLTGLWQVSGRSSVSYEQRVAMDMFYVMNWSFWMDLYILGKTVLTVLTCRGSC